MSKPTIDEGQAGSGDETVSPMAMTAGVAPVADNPDRSRLSADQCTRMPRDWAFEFLRRLPGSDFIPFPVKGIKADKYVDNRIISVWACATDFLYFRSSFD